MLKRVTVQKTPPIIDSAETPRKLHWRLRALRDRFTRRAVDRGLSARLTGYRGVRRIRLTDYVDSAARRGLKADLRVLEAEQRRENPLPINVHERADLPAERGWWRHSFHDVPSRLSTATRIATLRDALIVSYRDEARGRDYYPAILLEDRFALDMREIRFRRGHAHVLRTAPAPAHAEEGVWFAERVYDNHSHWLAAHLPKLLLIRELGLIPKCSCRTSGRP